MRLNRVLVASWIVLWIASVTDVVAQVWKPTGANGNGTRVACSADGTIVVAVGEDPGIPCFEGITESTNSGLFWTVESDLSGVDVAASAGGTEALVVSEVCGNQLFTYSAGTGWLSF